MDRTARSIHLRLTPWGGPRGLDPIRWTALMTMRPGFALFGNDANRTASPEAPNPIRRICQRSASEVGQRCRSPGVALVGDSVSTLQPPVKGLESQAFLSALAASSKDPIIGKTLDGTILLWNEAAERLYGYKASEMLGCNVSVLIPPDRPEELSYLLDRVQAGETVPKFPDQAAPEERDRSRCLDHRFSGYRL